MTAALARAFLIALSTIILLSVSSCSRQPQTPVVIDKDEFADLQQVKIYRAEAGAAQATDVKGIALLLGTETDWSNGSEHLATQLAASGWLVAGIHMDKFVSARKAQNVSCLELVTLLDVFSQHLQQRYRISTYQRPLLVGYRDGGSIAYLTLAQADAGIFRGAISLGLNPQISLPLPFCEHDGGSTKTIGTTQQQLLPVPRVAARWSVWSKTADDTALQALLQTMKVAGIHTENIGHDDDIEDWLPAALKDIDSQGSSDLADLPLVEMPANNSNVGYFAIVISGDGGWANIDRDIGNALNARGINVVGWNSLQYFWTRRTPESSAADLARVMQHYRKQWQKPRVLLVGFSMGADVLPFMLNRITQSERDSLLSVALLNASSSVDFEFHVSNWLNTGSSQDLKTLPELEKLNALPVQCIYGHDNDDNACSAIKASPQWHVIELPGDHHFDGDYDKVTDVILANLSAEARR